MARHSIGYKNSDKKDKTHEYIHFVEGCSANNARKARRSNRYQFERSIFEPMTLNTCFIRFTSVPSMLPRQI